MSASISVEDHALLVQAKRTLERVSLAAKISNFIGQPIEKLVRKLPAGSGDIILSASEKAIQTSMSAALFTLNSRMQASSNRLHKIGAATSGIVGGTFGLPALAIELPVSTTIMLRSIADIARSHGEDLASPACQVACVEVFALGGPGDNDDGADSGYFAVRAALARSVSDAVSYMATSTATSQSAPLLVRLVSQIAARFSIPVTGKVAAQTVPVIGGIGGGIVNTLFIGHFQDMASGHFVVRKLERIYGKDRVSAEYLNIEIGDDEG